MKYEETCYDGENIACNCVVERFNGINYDRQFIDCDVMRAAKLVPLPNEFRLLIIMSPILLITGLAFLICFVSTKVRFVRPIGYTYMGLLLLEGLLFIKTTIDHKLNYSSGNLLVIIDAQIVFYCLWLYYFMGRLDSKFAFMDTLLAKGENWVFDYRRAYN